VKVVRSVLKSVGLPRLLHPFRGPVTWACQRGWLPQGVRKFLPWRWAVEPFTIYGDNWQIQWYPTEFDSVGQRLFWSGMRLWEKETSPVILDHVRRSKCFVDIGANCGIYSVIGCRINPQVRVVAFEPVPKIRATLTNNISKNHFDSRVTVMGVALGETNGVVSFHEAEDATMGSLAVEGYHGQQGNVIQVNCRTLDAVVEELEIEPDFMKIDVEGFEHVVLAGATSTLSRFRPRIVLEANYGDPGTAMTQILSRYGYEFYLIGAHGLEKRPEIIPDPRYNNWLCLPSA
jgi:FkbM family methyltransferase